MSELWKILQDIITKTRPAIESIWVGIAIAAIMGGLSYLADANGTFTLQSLLGAALAAGFNYFTSKARREETKAVKAELHEATKNDF